MSSGPGIFNGEDLDAWIAHFKLGMNLRGAFEELGVSTVEDISLIYDDPDILGEVEGKLNKIDFAKFKRAKLWTNVDTPPVSAPEVIAHVDPGAAMLDSSTVRRTATGTRRTTTTTASTATAAASAAPDPSVFYRAEDMAALAKRKAEADKMLRDAMYVEKKAKIIEKQSRRVIRLEQELKNASSIDMAFLLDCTGSMDDYIAAAKTSILEFARTVGSLSPHISLRVAFVGYRDHCDKDRLAVLPFTLDIAEFERFVGVQKATGGGGDGPEDVSGGMNVVKNLEWQSALRFVYHVGDSPCHGMAYHGPDKNFGRYSGDSHPAGDPHGLIPEQIVSDLRNMQVQYFFGRLGSYTDMMIAKFNTFVGGMYIISENMDAKSMMSTITSSIVTSVSTSVSSTSRTDDKKHEKKVVMIVEGEPTWSTVDEERAMVFRMTVPDSIESIIEVFDPEADKCIMDFPDPIPIRMKIAPFPFAQGAMRAAHYAQFLDTASAGVVKEVLYVKDSMRTKERYEATLQCHRIGKCLALEFNRQKPSDCPSIEFCDANILWMSGRPGQPFMAMETSVPGAFEKYNANNGHVGKNPSPAGTNHEAVQAFSHWTYQVSRGNLLLVDCQGGYDRASNRFVLTDPAVHCKDLSRFGGTNMGTKGMNYFFSTHVCNGHCRRLHLEMPATV